MGASLFCRLSKAHPHAISALQSQYRMCATITELSNAFTYGDRLRCDSPNVVDAKLEYTSSTYLSSWLKKVVTTFNYNQREIGYEKYILKP
ncbi:DNA replication helicase [Artemisia annua]|uniref:DNA replication helicase n=1 Tax=Artemisia annua TaxID=35608 RepID=A0A2U1MHQ0_ARTAN|nr:DNA replication helicase [Artemisia annua]